MPVLNRRAACAAAFALALALLPGISFAQAALQSWNDGPAKAAIVAFVHKVTQPGADFVPPDQRIAVFDNDGTLWAEQPIYFEGMFAFDQVKALAAADPKLRDQQPFKAVLDGDSAAMAAFTDTDIVKLIAATHSGMTPEAFDATVKTWLASARHPILKRPYTSLVYQPQLELLAYLRANGFKTYIVSGGGVDFMRAFAQDAYGIPPEQVIGSSGKTRFEVTNGKAELVKLPEVGSIDDKDGKPININLEIGRRPILAFGNSDGDLAMLQYVASGSRPNLELLVHHDDAAREFAYDRASKIGTLDKAWDEAIARDWIVVSMKSDWKVVFPPPAEAAR
jgi:phosphoglycolate phosphatase-like HAD superfamily hydrolase